MIKFKNGIYIDAKIKKKRLHSIRFLMLAIFFFLIFRLFFLIYIYLCKLYKFGMTKLIKIIYFIYKLTVQYN